MSVLSEIRPSHFFPLWYLIPFSCVPYSSIQQATDAEFKRRVQTGRTPEFRGCALRGAHSRATPFTNRKLDVSPPAKREIAAYFCCSFDHHYTVGVVKIFHSEMHPVLTRHVDHSSYHPSKAATCFDSAGTSHAVIQWEMLTLWTDVERWHLWLIGRYRNPNPRRSWYITTHRRIFLGHILTLSPTSTHSQLHQQVHPRPALALSPHRRWLSSQPSRPPRPS